MSGVSICLYWWRGLGIVMGSVIVLSANSSVAQITTDGTLPNNSNVRLEDNTRIIEGGTARGANLFHSFSEFSVPTNSTAFFNNAANIQNILTRVTGGSISNIDGIIKANGTANLFLINPNGIIFGQNARLDIGGSFVASTASAIKFKDNFEFSAKNPQSAPLLTITAPVGLGLGNNPGEIKVNGLGHDIVYNDIKEEQPRPRVTSGVSGLEVQEGKTLALVGGKVSLEGGILKSPEGRIEIGSVGSNANVSLVSVSEGWKLSYQGMTNFEDIQFSGKTFVDTTGDGGGFIAIAGKDINITGQSIVLSDTYGDRNSGEISVLSDNNITVNESDLSTNTFASGNAGPIQLVAKKSIFLENNGSAGNHTEGTGDAGEITLKAGSIVVKNDSGLGSNTYSEGNAGRIKVEANSLRITEQSGFSTFSQGKGNAGEINITVDGELVLSNGGGFGSQAYKAGDGGKINITANSFLIEKNSGFSTDTEPGSSGNAGEISVNTNSFVIRESSGVSSNTSGTGNAGKISVNTNSLLLEENVGLDSFVKKDSSGNGGEIDIKAGSLTVQKESRITTNSEEGGGNAGKISITAQSLLVQDFAGISSNTEQSSKGNGGEIKVDTGSLTIQRNAGINTSSSNTGNAGKISITAQSLQIQDSAGIGSNTQKSSTGNGGEITVNAGSLLMRNNATINSGTEATGSAGNLTVRANNLVLENNGRLQVESTGTGNAGTLNITADNIRLDKQSRISGSTTSGNGGDLILNVTDLLLLRRNSQISATAGTENQGGDGGNITINAPNGFIVAPPKENSDITANAFTGKGGRVQINAKSIFGIQPRSRLTPQNDITASSERGISGTVEINTPDIDATRGFIELPTNLVDVSGQISTACTPGSRQSQSSFVSTGRGGLPMSPTEPLQDTSTLSAWVRLRPKPANSAKTTISPQPTAVSNTTKVAAATPIVEATGWIVDSNGNIELVAQTPQVSPRSPWQTPASCPVKDYQKL
ncbi:S-layer family protein [Brasilonema sp. UFV-L1]|nr:S-layer family protein [Brasilonema sp. UFV-L1]NMG07458.1 hypothetical protein [Brasilonema sp. UFV-L1]